MRIFKHTKGIKLRAIKLKGRLKIRLSGRKLKRHTGRKYKKMFTPHNVQPNIVDNGNIAAQNVPPDESISSFTQRTKKQLSPKRRKKQYNKETANKCFIDNTTSWDASEQQIEGEEDDDWRIDFSNEDLKGKKDDDWTQIASTVQRNFDSPIVIKMSSDDSTMFSVPKIFGQRLKIQSEIDTYDRKIFTRETCSKEDNVHITDSECMNPDNSHLSAEYEESVLPVLWDANKTDNTKYSGTVGNSELENIAVNDKAIHANSIPAHRESVESSERSTNSNNNAKTYEESPQLEDISELYYEAEDNAAISNSRLEDASSENIKYVSKYSHKVPHVQLYSFRSIVIVIMEKGSAFGFIGKLSVKVLYGTVEIYGVVLNASKGPKVVYSPKGYSNVVVKTCEEVPHDGTINGIWTELFAEGITRDSETKLMEDIDKIEPGTAVLVLQNIENSLTHFLKTYYPLKLFPDIKNTGYYPWLSRHRAEIVLQAHLQMKYHELCRKGLIFNPRITDVANRMLERWHANSWSCALIAGGKSVGKSTNMRFLINKLLHTCKKVVLVDVDPGQSECTPSGCVSYSLIEQSLLGPNFTHLQMPVYQLFIDEIDVTQCVTRYLEAIKVMIAKLKNCPELSRLPIVVNTMGFTKHIGWDLMISTIKLIRPSIIVQIMSAKHKNNYRNILNASIVNREDYKWMSHNIALADWNKPCDHELLLIRSNAEDKMSKKKDMEPYQYRELVMISYLSGITQDSYDPFQCSEDMSLNINEVVPYTTSFSSLYIIPQRLLGIPASHALSVINGNIVALCGIDLAEEEEDYSQRSDDTSDLRVLTHKTPLCTCYGFGIIRGVDMKQKEIFINTPLPMSMMQHINCLAGCIPVPLPLWQGNEGAPYVGRDASLPTSRKTVKGFNMRYKKRSETDMRKSSQDTRLRENTVKYRSMSQ